MQMLLLRVYFKNVKTQEKGLKPNPLALGVI